MALSIKDPTLLQGKVLTSAEVAEILGTSVRWVRDHIPGTLVGKWLTYNGDSVIHYITALLDPVLAHQQKGGDPSQLPPPDCTLEEWQAFCHQYFHKGVSWMELDAVPPTPVPPVEPLEVTTIEQPPRTIKQT